MVYQSGTDVKRSKYRLLGLIGQGQFGQVFCAVHRQTGRLVALKNLEHERFPTHKFLRELRFLLSLQHPNIVTCSALEHTSTGRYLVMDYCEGGTLRNLIAEESYPTLLYSLKIVSDVLAGLEHAHSRGIVHCDIKPENILMHVHSTGWTARISDFGIARLTQEISSQEGDTGSPAYMAPERFYGQYSAASDLYSVGILLFELMTGYRPFSGTPAELMSAHLNKPLRLPDTIPTAWRPFLVQALQKLPARRFRSAAEMLAAMRAIAATEPETDWEHRATRQIPLFLTAIAPLECPFQVLHQQPLSHAVTALVSAPVPPLPQEPELSLALPIKPKLTLYQAAACQLSQHIYPAHDLWAQGEADFARQAAFTQPVEQLLIRPQGCFAVTRRAVVLMPFDAAVTEDSDWQMIRQWSRDILLAIDPSGSWLAATLAGEGCQLDFCSLQRRFALPSRPVALEPLPPQTQLLALLALDSRHLAMVSVGCPEQATAETSFGIVTRRGTWVGSLQLALRLQQITLTPTPYRLLATDHHPGTILLIDLKPYRVKRLWVEITPTFLASTSWGYVLAAAQGRIIFIDYAGRQLGAVNSPAPITAMTLVEQNRLLVATWSGDTGMLYCLDLLTLGLDLIF